MSQFFKCFAVVGLLSVNVSLVAQQPTSNIPAETEKAVAPQSYEYEIKPDDPAFRIFNPRKAPPLRATILKKGDRLAICGDSITEQKMYSRMIETYLTACAPQWQISVRQYGWSGETTAGFLHRMERDCLRFHPTVATLCYGMNDARYRPFDVTNGRWYEDHYRAIVQTFKQADARVVVGSPGCAGKLATWVKSRAGTLDELNVNLCALRDIAIEVSESENVAFADIFWPMLQAQVFAPSQHAATVDQPYEVAGKDGIHPDWAGHTIMAWAFLRAMGVDGEIATIDYRPSDGTAKVSDGHVIEACDSSRLVIRSSRYPFCATGSVDRDNSIRSGMTLVPFNESLNRFTLKVSGLDRGNYQVNWGKHVQTFSSEQLISGVNLADVFTENPFCEAFAKVDAAVAEKQAYETKQIKESFHGREGANDFEGVVTATEAERRKLLDAITNAMQPVVHSLSISKRVNP